MAPSGKKLLVASANSSSLAHFLVVSSACIFFLSPWQQRTGANAEEIRSVLPPRSDKLVENIPTPRNNTAPSLCDENFLDHSKNTTSNNSSNYYDDDDDDDKNGNYTGGNNSSWHPCFGNVTSADPKATLVVGRGDSAAATALSPTKSPTRNPTARPTNEPTREPTRRPNRRPTRRPTADPTRRSTAEPTSWPFSPGEGGYPTLFPFRRDLFLAQQGVLVDDDDDDEHFEKG
ncbi:expressed unknown protein [Seminavis robusta]|uniref:Uncharacterized protein n=1 Tax=Seminavis robusta TaxID=568900 RepID=A0A9N8E7S4_9STRA|nr:expressed unknown protein [Seminavis robusta]|eukprot:Sro603_g173970.1 n/a (232) ;mRNA; f:33917-34612